MLLCLHTMYLALSVILYFVYLSKTELALEMMDSRDEFHFSSKESQEEEYDCFILRAQCRERVGVT